MLIYHCILIAAFGGGWGYSQKSVDAILMTTDTDILLHGLGMFAHCTRPIHEKGFFLLGFFWIRIEVLSNAQNIRIRLM